MLARGLLAPTVIAVAFVSLVGAARPAVGQPAPAVEPAGVVPGELGLPRFSLGAGVGWPQIVHLAASYWALPQVTVDLDAGGVAAPAGHIGAASLRGTFHVAKPARTPRTALLLTAGVGTIDATLFDLEDHAAYGILGIGAGHVGRLWDVRATLWLTTEEPEKVFFSLSAAWTWRGAPRQFAAPPPAAP